MISSFDGSKKIFLRQQFLLQFVSLSFVHAELRSESFFFSLSIFKGFQLQISASFMVHIFPQNKIFFGVMLLKKSFYVWVNCFDLPSSRLFFFPPLARHTASDWKISLEERRLLKFLELTADLYLVLTFQPQVKDSTRIMLLSQLH